jgi:hypothetical protein
LILLKPGVLCTSGFLLDLCFTQTTTYAHLDFMDELLVLFVGIGLAAACGFRVFVPLFIASLAANGNVELFGDADLTGMLGTQYDWLGSTPVTLALGIATLLEIGSYYIPWLDNALDSVATPASIIAGTFITSAAMPEMMGDGFFKWLVAVIAGGGTAGLVQGASVILRGTSTATTAGVGNPLVSTAELGGSILTSVLAILLPTVAAIAVLVLMVFVIYTIVRFVKKRKASEG